MGNFHHPSQIIHDIVSQLLLVVTRTFGTSFWMELDLKSITNVKFRKIDKDSITSVSSTMTVTNTNNSHYYFQHLLSVQIIPETIPGGLYMCRLNICKLIRSVPGPIKCSEVLTTVIIYIKVGIITIVYWKKPEVLSLRKLPKAMQLTNDIIRIGIESVRLQSPFSYHYLHNSFQRKKSNRLHCVMSIIHII